MSGRTPDVAVVLRGRHGHDGGPRRLAETLEHPNAGTAPEHPRLIHRRDRHQPDPRRLIGVDPDALHLSRLRRMDLVVDSALIHPFIRAGLHVYVPSETGWARGTPVAKSGRGRGHTLFTVQLDGSRARPRVEYLSICLPPGSGGAEKFQRLL